MATKDPVRHAASRWEYGRQPSRNDQLTAAVTEEQRADPGPAKRPPGRKDTRQWCKGIEGRLHVREIIYDGRPSYHARDGCVWAPAWSRRLRGWSGVAWDCFHVEQCTECKKILRKRHELELSECPDYPGTPEQKTAAAAEVQRRNDLPASSPGVASRRQARDSQRGTSGFRRPKAGGRA